jgi:hypothetical protein
MDCYTSKEPTFKDCFIARASWTAMTKRSTHSTSTSTSPSTSPSTSGKGEIHTPTTQNYTSGLGSMVLFSLFFKKLSLLNPNSKLFCQDNKEQTMHPLCRAEGGHFLHNLIPILLMGATSVKTVDRFAQMYSNVELSECKHLHTCTPAHLHTHTPTHLLPPPPAPTPLQTDT